MITVKCHVGIARGAAIMLIGFADSCSRAYSVFMYVLLHFRITCQSITFVFRVALPKVITMPCTALSLSKMMRTVLQSYSSRHIFDSIIAFIHSTVALLCIRSEPSNRKPSSQIAEH